MNDAASPAVATRSKVARLSPATTAKSGPRFEVKERSNRIMRARPELGGDQTYQIECPNDFLATAGSPSSDVAPRVVPRTLPEAEGNSWASAKLSLSGGGSMVRKRETTPSSSAAATRNW